MPRDRSTASSFAPWSARRRPASPEDRPFGVVESAAASPPGPDGTAPEGSVTPLRYARLARRRAEEEILHHAAAGHFVASTQPDVEVIQRRRPDPRRFPAERPLLVAGP